MCFGAGWGVKAQLIPSSTKKSINHPIYEFEVCTEKSLTLSRQVTKDALSAMCYALLDPSGPVRKDAAYSFGVLGRLANADDLNAIVDKYLMKTSDNAGQGAQISRALVEVVKKCGDRLDGEIKDKISVQAFVQKQLEEETAEENKEQYKF